MSTFASPAETDRPTTLAGRARQGLVAAVWRGRSLAFVDRAGPAEHTVLLLGSARSGTTWLSEIIDRRGDHRVIFEPLKAGTHPALRPWWRVTYLRPGTETTDQRTAMDRLLAGRLRGPWMDHTNKALLPTRRLVKEIHANPLAPWLAATYPGTRQVVLVRHPHAVVASRLKLGWRERLDTLLADEQLVADHLGESAGALRGLTDPYLRMTAQWAIETVVPIRGIVPTDAVCLVTYESLRNDPLSAVSRVLAHLGDEVDDTLQAALTKPSRTKDMTARRTPAGAEATAGQRAAAQDIVDALGLGGLYRIEEPGPLTDDWDEVRRAVRA